MGSAGGPPMILIGKSRLIGAILRLADANPLGEETCGDRGKGSYRGKADLAADFLK